VNLVRKVVTVDRYQDMSDMGVNQTGTPLNPG
jgi:hypothetical protein